MASVPSIVLGISHDHGDSSAALIVEGRLVAAAEEERFNRIKHYGLFPARAIEYCLREARLSARDVEVVALARRPLNQLAKRVRTIWHHPGLWRMRQKGGDKPESLSRMLKEAGLRARVVRVEHHVSHLMSARILADIEDVALLSVDGLGDFVSATMGKVYGNGVQILGRQTFPHSLGFFYTAMTQYLGFPHFGDEFKVMGLSSYGEPTFLPHLRQLIREVGPFFELNLEAFPILKQPMRFYLQNGQPVTEPFFNRNLLTAMLGVAPRKPKEPLTRLHWNLAKSVQARFEEVANHMLKELHAKVPAKCIALSGGCAHNSVWVGKIPSSSPFGKVIVAPASSDAGIAVGAAAYAAQRQIVVGGHPALLGPGSLSEGWQRPAETSAGIDERTFRDDDKLVEWMAEELAAGKILGLFHGRMELGPRALGSRSILADPRVAEMRDRLNQRVKHREPFRPFAASVLWEHQDDWFEDSFYAPTMEAVFPVRQSRRTRIAAVVHVDNSCRIQSVRKEDQPFYWKLIEAFRRKTGVPMLVNTSFNDCEPIVCTEEDAWKCFTNSDIDHLVVGNRAFSRARAAALVG